MMTRMHRRRATWVWYSVPLFLALLLYLAFLSASLDDFDSYSFALALEQFDLALQQPQPPGFPIYIALARALNTLLPGARLTLTTLSAFCGALATGLVGLIGWRLAARLPVQEQRFAATFAALLFCFAPVSWLTSEKALSDMPGLLGALLPLWLWDRWWAKRIPGDSSHAPWLAAIATGIALGIRPQNALPIALWIGGAMLTDLIRERATRPLLQRARPWLVGACFGMLGILVWLVPMTLQTGGLAAYLDLVRDHAAHVGRADSLMGLVRTSGSFLTALRARSIAFADMLLIALTADGAIPPFRSALSWRILALAVVVLPGLLRADWSDRAPQQVAIWLGAVTAQIFLIETLDRPRLLLPLAPPLALLVASGWARMRLPNLMRAAVMAGIPFALLIQGLPLAAILSRTAAPPAQATAHILATYPDAKTLVAAAGTFRAAQVDLHTYPLIYLYRFDPARANELLNAGATYVAILDRDQWTVDAIDILTRQGSWVTVEDLTFTRDRRVHTQHDQVRLQVLTPPEHVPASALLLPAGGCIDIGGDSDGRYLGQGWFRPEEIGGVAGRWAGQTLTSTLRINLTMTEDLVVTMRALAFAKSQRVAIRINSIEIGSLEQPKAWTELTAIIPRTAWTAGESSLLELVHTTIASPAAVTEGSSSDTRELTTAYDWLCFRSTSSQTP